MVTAARRLSGGEACRLALACALVEARRTARPALIIADEFAAMLDDVSAAALCAAVRRLIGSPAGESLALLVATARTDLLRHLRPDQVIFKPLGGAAQVFRPRWSAGKVPATRPWLSQPRRWRIVRGSLQDYRMLAGFHYLAGPPAAHKRVYVIRVGGRAGFCGRFCPVAGVLVISPPLLNVRGRNIATAGRYATGRRAAAVARLNAEVEAISRVVVHPSYRGLGLAKRLVRHALAKAQMPIVECLAVMGRIHPLFDRAGMAAYHVPAPRRRPYVYYFWIAPRGHRAYRYPPETAKRRLRGASTARGAKG
jgi:ABC-type ATPase with predicted acetyltransferase domain